MLWPSAYQTEGVVIWLFIFLPYHRLTRLQKWSCGYCWPLVIIVLVAKIKLVLEHRQLYCWDYILVMSAQGSWHCNISASCVSTFETNILWYCLNLIIIFHKYIVMWSSKMSWNLQILILRYSQSKQITSLFPVVFATLQHSVSLEPIDQFQWRLL